MGMTDRVRILEDGISSREAAFQKNLDDFKAKFLSLWRSSGDADPVPGQRFDSADQAKNERETDLLVRYFDEQVRLYPESPAEQESWRVRMRDRVKRFGVECFRFPDQYLNIIFSDAYLRVTSDFARQARAFDKQLELEALSQAMRNVWVMNCLQMFLGKGISLTPSVFAYSMLYPYTDNFLDDPEVSPDAKREICRRLGLRLAGVPVPSPDRHEKNVHRLVAMIEDEYARREHPEVFWILLGIHRGQVRSLAQQCAGQPPEEERILDISLQKGGASVLADGYLVAGKLSRAAAEFFFGFGVVLQLFDDLQDVAQDLEEKRWTLFSSNARLHPLDTLAGRLHGFLVSVLLSAPRFPITFKAQLTDLIQRNCGFTLLLSVSQNRRLFQPGFVRKMERYSPLRFDYLETLRAEIAAKQASLRQDFLEKKNLPTLYHLLA